MNRYPRAWLCAESTWPALPPAEPGGLTTEHAIGTDLLRARESFESLQAQLLRHRLELTLPPAESIRWLFLRTRTLGRRRSICTPVPWPWPRRPECLCPTTG